MGRAIILGLGNTLNHDEGLGVQALKRLEDRLGTQARVELIDGGTLGLSLLPLVEACDRLLVLDAVDAGRPPGTIVELQGDEIPLYSGIKVSQHQVTFQEVLGLAHIRGKLPPDLHLIGIQPVDLAIGIGLSPVVELVMPDLIERAMTVLRAWELAT
jgi:hydrogenase maturation protease